MLDAFLVILNHSAPEIGLVDDFSDILIDELVGLDIRLRAKTKALLGCLDNSHICVFFSLKPLVLAVLAAAAIIQALNSGCSVDAV